MKKFIIVVLSCIVALSGISLSVLAANTEEDIDSISEPLYAIEDLDIQAALENVSGTLPYFQRNLATEAFGIINFCNTKVAKFYEETLEDAEKIDGAVPTVHFSYQIIGDDDYLSVVMHSSINYGNTGSDDVETIVLARNEYAIYNSLDNILGPNAFTISDEYILDQMSAQPEYYFIEEFEGTDKNTCFYVNEKSDVMIIFDKYELAPGYMGNPEFAIDLSKFTNFDVGSSDYFITPDGVIMVPVASVLRAFNYYVAWDGSATLRKDGVTFKLLSDVNDYNGKKYEQAPELKNGRMYVPTSFLEEMFGLHVALENQMVTFSKLGATQSTSSSVDKSSPLKVAIGVIEDGTMNNLIIKNSADHKLLHFATADADKSEVNSLLIGKAVIILYEELTKNSMRAVKIISVEGN